VVDGTVSCPGAIILAKLVLAILDAASLETAGACVRRWLLDAMPSAESLPDIRNLYFRLILVLMGTDVERNLTEAQVLLHTAVEASAQDAFASLYLSLLTPPSSPPSYDWLLKRQLDINLSLEASRDRQEILKELESNSGKLNLRDLPFSSVPRIHASELSPESFLEKFAIAKRPVVVHGLDVGLPPANAWDEVAKLCGSLPVRKLARSQPGASTWAKLDYMSVNMTLEHVLTHIGAGENERGSYMLFDFSLNQPGSSCQSLLERFRVPRYFTGDIFKRRLSNASAPPPDPFASHPGLFVQPAGSRSGWHIDGFGSHFWQVLLQGRKRWRLLPFATPALRRAWLCEGLRMELVLEQGPPPFFRRTSSRKHLPDEPAETCPALAGARLFILFA